MKIYNDSDIFAVVIPQLTLSVFQELGINDTFCILEISRWTKQSLRYSEHLCQ